MVGARPFFVELGNNHLPAVDAALLSILLLVAFLLKLPVGLLSYTQALLKLYCLPRLFFEHFYQFCLLASESLPSGTYATLKLLFELSNLLTSLLAFLPRAFDDIYLFFLRAD